MTTKTPADSGRDAASEGNAPASKRRVLSRDDVPALLEAMGADGERRFLTADEILALPDDPDAASGDPPAEFVEIDGRRFAKIASETTKLSDVIAGSSLGVRTAFADLAKVQDGFAATLAGQALAGPGFRAALAAIGIQNTAASLAGLDKLAAMQTFAPGIRAIVDSINGKSAIADALNAKIDATEAFNMASINTAASAIAKSLAGIDDVAAMQAQMLNPALLDAITGSFAAMTQRALARQERFGRYRDRAGDHITADHVAAAIPHLDWDAFIAAQRDIDDSEAQAQLLDDLAAALAGEGAATDAARAAIARELLWLAWAHVAIHLLFDDAAPAATPKDAAGRVTEAPENVTRFLETQMSEGGADFWPFLADHYVERDILEGVWDAYQKAALPAAPNYAPAFRDGVGNVTTHAVAHGAARAQVEPWITGDDGAPEFRHAWGKNGHARYRIDADAAPSVEAAWDVVKGLGDRHADTLDYINAKWIANRDAAANGLHLTASEVLDAMGYKKQSAGGHKSENVEMIADIIRDLERQTVESRFEYYPPGRKKPELIAIESKLVVSSTSAARLTLYGEKRRYAWYIRPGDWAIQLHDLQQQYGVALLAVLRLNPQSDYIAKRIGRYLLHSWRERYLSDDLARPYRVANLLDKAGVPIDRAKAGRFRTRVEAAFDVLRETNVLQSWAYGADVPTPEGRWLAGWLAGGVTITPNPAVIAHKQAFLTTRRRGAKALDKGAAARKPAD
jgi:hypothetical protein